MHHSVATAQIAREPVVTETPSSDILAMRPFTQRFEAGLAALPDRREAIACSSGTAGLYLGVRALEIGDGDEVITTPFSFVASANCLLYERAVPRFVDIEENSLGIDPDLVEVAASNRTRAILPVHVFGRPCRIEAIEAVARRRGWTLIEDACEGLGSSVGGRPLASRFGSHPGLADRLGEVYTYLGDQPEQGAERDEERPG